MYVLTLILLTSGRNRSGRDYVLQRHCSADLGATLIGRNLECASQLAQTLTHPSQTNSQRPHPVLITLFQYLARHSFPLVSNVQCDRILRMRNADIGNRVSGMPLHISQALLKDSE